MKQIIKQVFPQTIPVMAGYISLGIAFGLLLQSIGYGPIWAFLMSLFIYAGSAQFLAVELLATGATLSHVALLTFLLNFRHLFYGLSMIEKYRGTGIRKLYLIFGLTDETYALLTGYKAPEGFSDKNYYFAVTLMNHLYWILGCVIGSVAGSIIPFNTTGIDFAMTALFAVLVIEQWKKHKNHIPAISGFLITIAALYIFGADRFLIPSLIVISFVLLYMKSSLDGEKNNE
ncbi:MAG: AzlC family ABC transporter permease [Erysipelotrichaceae bacterium]|nr:AzlC family ABC transporter permease [Erysipelotrichaceae bacterium]